MRKIFINGVLIFLALLIITFLLQEVFQADLGTINYFAHHGFFLLIGLAIFPRLTLLVSNISSGGLLWWLSWIFYPRLLIAVLATVSYFKTNPVLVILSWLIALSGETAEKLGIQRRFTIHRPIKVKKVVDETIIEAEYRNL